jgi:hypothetical protein
MAAVTPDQARDFYRAAASFYRQAPWHSVGQQLVSILFSREKNEPTPISRPERRMNRHRFLARRRVVARRPSQWVLFSSPWSTSFCNRT